MIQIPKRKGYLASLNCTSERHGDENVEAFDARIITEDLPVEQLGDAFGKGFDVGSLFWDSDGEMKTDHLGQISLPFIEHEEQHIFAALGFSESARKVHKAAIELKSGRRVDLSISVRVVKPGKGHALEKLAKRLKDMLEFSLLIDASAQTDLLGDG